MKEIMAIIRMNKINETKRALSAVGLPGLTATGRALGRGRGMVDYQLVRGAEAGYGEALVQLGTGPRLVPKRVLSIVVRDDKKDLAVQTIMDTNRTGEPGDGKIFVLPVAESIRVRTAERGEATLD
ncbi:MAG: P-II family nitrogen regulator [Spirochaetota bacterium]